MAPASTAVTQNGQGTTPPPLPPTEPVVQLYTAGPAIGPGTTQGYFNASYTPGSLISFLVRAKNDPVGCYTGSPLDANEASRVMLEITGTNGNTFYMVGNRAVALNDIS